MNLLQSIKMIFQCWLALHTFHINRNKHWFNSSIFWKSILYWTRFIKKCYCLIAFFLFFISFSFLQDVICIYTLCLLFSHFFFLITLSHLRSIHFKRRTAYTKLNSCSIFSFWFHFISNSWNQMWLCRNF